MFIVSLPQMQGVKMSEHYEIKETIFNGWKSGKGVVECLKCNKEIRKGDKAYIIEKDVMYVLKKGFISARFCSEKCAVAFLDFVNSSPELDILDNSQTPSNQSRDNIYIENENQGIKQELYLELLNQDELYK